MDILEILNYWLKITKFDAKQTSFRIFSNDWEFNDKNKKLIEFFNEWDQSGTIPVLYLKFLFNNVIKTKMFTLNDLFENNIENLEELKNLYNKFNSDEFKEIEKNIIKSFETILVQLNTKKLIGNLNSDDLLICAENVLEEVLNLNVDIYKKGSIIKPFNNFSNQINVFETVSQCLLTIEHSIDGVYLCYITKENSPDGYFGYYIKNNGNLFSINERINEKYIGQHKRMRNHRYAGAKSYDLFPYEIFDFEGNDYKGYATSHKIDKSKLTFDFLDIKSLMNIIVILYLLNKKYSNKILKGEEVYVNSLFDINVKTAIDFNKNELVPYSNNSSLIKIHKDFKIEFDKKSYFDGSLCNKFNRNSGKAYDETGTFQNINQGMVEKFGMDFDIETSLKDIFETDRTKLLLNSNAGKEIKVKDDYVFNNEFIGNRNKIELQAFFMSRKKLANHIINKQLESFKKFGGIEKLKEWYENLLISNVNMIKEKCIEVYKNEELGIKTVRHGFNNDDETRFKWIRYDNLNDKDSQQLHLLKSKNLINLNHIKYPYTWGDKIHTKDLDNQKEAFHYFNFEFINLKNLEEFFGIKFPDFCEGYYCPGYDFKPYTGNSILDVVDPIDELYSILCDRRNKETFYNFSFYIGFSKSNFNKMIKGKNEQ